ncbi:putative toxin-antitoxin system toxin component, PIN family [Candidatus Roizmanbacteria bacterium RIFCSPHIGHO2_01_FULL_35_10]|uniref:Putative toxin-antitoxin system toxin component, PIN family n=1 Tax=Candidatus Roizmanbacteria bacterium RIFCSPLOWO2_01_FULL_35_13 TaxID=1802055 RepID=A0A1F7I7Q1_9BACT|nr:MAG: putative toxin-antitoxin system toxin component, PIN family [Candidatus Roizmanbacteria bacterium RIFCSPHIGHO2_01_FULL_35_10]OGK39399.1 MAG: putative toxin-antitoxin system toxin component, PIN family [Candidatus Roizmanbacteria bacterium RIFCSPLOWO2_01_FULL_35_13]
MKKQFVQVIVFFNASVIIAGLRSPKGGSAKLLDCAKQKRITAIISNIIVNEVLKHQVKTSRNQSQIIDFLEKRFYIISEPSPKLINRFSSIVIDKGDIHVIASTLESTAHFLVTLDKKHLLSIKNKVKDFQIVTPGELITILT